MPANSPLGIHQRPAFMLISSRLTREPFGEDVPRVHRVYTGHSISTATQVLTSHPPSLTKTFTCSRPLQIIARILYQLLVTLESSRCTSTSPVILSQIEPGRAIDYQWHLVWNDGCESRPLTAPYSIRRHRKLSWLYNTQIVVRRSLANLSSYAIYPH